MAPAPMRRSYADAVGKAMPQPASEPVPTRVADLGRGVAPPVLAVLARQLDDLVDRTERAAAVRPGGGGAPPGAATVFHGVAAPTISVAQYLERIFTYANCSSSVFVMAYAYIDRFIELNPDVPVTGTCVHRLLVTAVLVAAKFLDDIYYSNAYYAKVGGIPTAELNALELELLQRLDFRLHISPERLEQYCAHLEGAAQQYAAQSSYAAAVHGQPCAPQRRNLLAAATFGHAIGAG